MAWNITHRIALKSCPGFFRLWGIADMQEGGRASIPDVLEMRTEEILAERGPSGIVIAGDIEDEDRPSTRAIRRASFAERAEVVERDADKHAAWLDKKVIPKLIPLHKETSHGIMAVLAGHHWTQLTPVMNSVQYICREVGRLTGRPVPYCGEMSTFIDLRFESPYRVGHGVRKVGHIQHGCGGGQAIGAALRHLDRAAQGFDADFYIRAHDCRIEAMKMDRLAPKETQLAGEEPKLVARNLAFLNLGSATQGYRVTKERPEYPEGGMMRPTALGWGSLRFIVRRARRWEDPSTNLKADIRIEI